MHIPVTVLSEGAIFNDEERKATDMPNIGFYANVFIREDNFTAFEVCIGVAENSSDETEECGASLGVKICSGSHSIYRCGIDQVRRIRLLTDFGGAIHLFRNCWEFASLRKEMQKTARDYYKTQMEIGKCESPPEW